MVLFANSNFTSFQSCKLIDLQAEVARSELMFRCLDRERPPKVPRYAKDFRLLRLVIGQWVDVDGLFVLVYPNDESVK